MKTSVSYPDWAEKYRGKGRTIRKVRNGYGLYECTSVYVPGLKYPKSVQKYLGMITEKDGFIPKKTDIVSSPDPSVSLEYGLSHFITANFKRDLMRAAYSSTEEMIIFGIIYYLFDDFDPSYIPYTWLTHGKEKELMNRAAKGLDIRRLKSISNKADQFIVKSIPDQKERNLLVKLLFITTIGSNGDPDSVVYLPEVRNIAGKYGLKL